MNNVSVAEAGNLSTSEFSRVAWERVAAFALLKFGVPVIVLIGTPNTLKLCMLLKA